MKKKKFRGLKGILLGSALAVGSLFNGSAQNVWDVNPYLQPRSGKEYSQEWNKLWVLGTREDRVNFVDSLYSKDKTDTIKWNDLWKCITNVNQVEINLHGFPELKESETYNLNNNGLGNIPLYVTEIAIPGRDNHFVNSILVDSNYLDFNSWLKIESNDDSYPKIGDSNLPKDCEVILKKTIVNDQMQLTSFPFIKFKIENGNPSLVESSEYISREKPILDKNPPKVNFVSPSQNSIYSEGDRIKFEFETFDEENNLDSVSYSLDGKNWKYSNNEKSSLNIDPEIGEHTYYVKVSDWSPGNEPNYFIDSINFKVDKKPVGIEKKVLDELKVYPNPTSNYLKFENKTNEQSQLRIFNVNGQEIENVVDLDGNIEIDVGSYSNGIYFYQYENSDGIKNGKFVKK